MSETKFRRVLPEPAHPMVVKLHDDLVAIYSHIRDKYQGGIDQAFDRVSREVGFVVATALPFTFELGDGRAMGIIITDGLQGTLFDRELAKALKGIEKDPIPKVSAGTYRLYLFWFEALKLKLRTDWMEPAHFSVRLHSEEIRKIKEWLRHKEILKEVEELEKGAVVIPRPWEEPAHWFDPGSLIAAEERVLISVIDEVYPELRLVDRISQYRRGMGRILREEAGSSPGSGEPPHEMLTELKELLRRYGY